MRIESANNLGTTCKHLKLDENGRVFYLPTPNGVTVWDVDAEKQYAATWVLTLNLDFKTEERSPHVVTASRPVPAELKAIIEDQFLKPRQFASPECKQTIDSELAYRSATGRPHWKSSSVREREMGKPSRRFGRNT